MSSGEKEIVLASEEVNRRNIQTMIEYSKETRALVREIQEEVVRLRKAIAAQDQIIQGLNVRLAQVQQAMVKGGSEWLSQ